MQQCRIIYCSLTALHVSSDNFGHHQEHLNCIYSRWYYCRMSWPAGVMGELELKFERYFRSSSGASKLYLQPLVLLSHVVAGWCHG